MSGSVNIDPGTNPTVPVAVDQVNAADEQIIKLDIGGPGAQSMVSTTNALPVSDSLVETGLGATGDAAAGSDSGSFSLISLFKRQLSKLTSLVTSVTDIDALLTAVKTDTDNLPTQGQKTTAGSLPVTLPSDMAPAPIAMTDTQVALKSIMSVLARPGWVFPANNNLKVDLNYSTTYPGATTDASVGVNPNTAPVFSLDHFRSSSSIAAGPFNAKDTMLNTLDRGLWNQSVRARIT